MSEFVFRPAIREQIPMIIGLAGPSKSGKTLSAHRLAVGLAQGGQVAMINTEGPKGHQYADKFKYVKVDMDEPFSMKRYLEAIKAAAEIKPSVLIIDSMSHAHEGIGGMLDQHESELDRMAGNDYKKRERMTWAAWTRPKADEAIMINTMLQMRCHIVLCFRGKEKIKIVKGQQPIDMGWQPIASDRIHFETAFTLILPPHSRGTPDLSVSEFREPYDTMVKNEQLNEGLGERLAEWAKGKDSLRVSAGNSEAKQYLKSIQDSLVRVWPGKSASDTKAKVGMIARAFNGASWKDLEKMDVNALSVVAERFGRFAEEIAGGSSEQLTEEMAIQAWGKVVMTESGEIGADD